MGTKSTDVKGDRKMLIVQGDVFLTPCAVPKGAAKKEGWVLAEGENTGHMHAVVEQDCAELYEKDGVLYLSASADITVRHEEHKTVSVPAGEWKVGIVQEYDEFEQAARNVRD
jgi:hypothetical protein